MYFNIPAALGSQQQLLVHTSQLLFGFQKVTKLKIQVSCFGDKTANICLCVQAAISEHLPYPENHQSPDSAAPRATRLL